jgi:hypothetical protein
MFIKEKRCLLLCRQQNEFYFAFSNKYTQVLLITSECNVILFKYYDITKYENMRKICYTRIHLQLNYFKQIENCYFNFIFKPT